MTCHMPCRMPCHMPWHNLPRTTCLAHDLSHASCPVTCVWVGCVIGSSGACSCVAQSSCLALFCHTPCVSRASCLSGSLTAQLFVGAPDSRNQVGCCHVACHVPVVCHGACSRSQVSCCHMAHVTCHVTLRRWTLGQHDSTRRDSAAARSRHR